MVNQNNNKNNQQKKEDNVFRFEVREDQCQEFRDLFEGDLRLLSYLSGVVSNYFYHIYNDLDGCVITCNPSFASGFEVRLYFSYKKEGYGGKSPFRAFDLVDNSKPEKTKTIDMIRFIHSSRMNRKLYNMTKEGKEGLAKFIPGFTPETAMSKSTDWSKVVHEQSSVNNLGQVSTCVYVTGLDLNLIIRDIYGKTENGEPVQYDVMPIRPHNGNIDAVTGAPIDNAASDWLVMIRRINSSDLDKVCKELGMKPIANGIPGLVRPTMTTMR